jgi:hypothetical protein
LYGFAIGTFYCCNLQAALAHFGLKDSDIHAVLAKAATLKDNVFYNWQKK